jgi:MerR family transcriptional regulator, thiopeptide resistance regulator
VGYSVGQVAALAGVSVRTLHHYDDVGLVTPGGRTSGGYRLYGEADLARLRDVLSYRELGFSLEQVRQILDDPLTDPAEHLRAQHRLVRERITRLERVLAHLEKRLEAEQMGIDLTPEEQLEVFGEGWRGEEYAAEAEQRWGDTDAFRESQRRASAYTKDDWLRIRHEGEHLSESFAAAFRAGLPVDSPEVARVATEHREHISRWFYEVSPQMHAGLARMYVDDQRFAATYDAVEPGLARYTSEVILALYPSDSSESSESSGS